MARYLFLLAKTNDRKFKQKTEGKKEKTEEAHLPGPPRPNSPSQPAQPTFSPVVFSRQAHSCVATMPWPPTSPRPPPASPRLLLASGGFAQQAASISPSAHRLSPPLFFIFVDIRKPPERAAVADVATVP